MIYHVSPSGDDANPGSEANPFRTLAKTSAVLQPGDTAVLHGGVYRETLRPERSGTAAQPIIFRAADGGEVAMISGADALTDWRAEDGGLWSAPMAWGLNDGNQLFADGAVLAEARWPHTPNQDVALLQPVRATATAGSATTLTDPALTGAADAWTGALLWCCGGHKWICWGARVTGFDPATHTLTFDGEWPKTHWYTPCAGSEYVLLGAKAALDVPGEWWFDRAGRRLWLCPPAGTTPDKLTIEAKARTTAIDLRGREHIRLAGLHFRAGGVLTDDGSRHLRFDRLAGEYVAHSYAKDVSEQAIVVAGEHNVVHSCEFAFSSGSVLRLRGRDNKVINCHIRAGDYGGLWSGTVSLAGRRHVFSHNTVRHSGRDLVTIHGLMESLIQYNDLSYAGWLTHDLGITYGHDTDFANTQIRFNWVHDNVAKGLAEGIYFDHCSHNVLVHHNLIWNIPGMPVQVNNPGHFNLIAHNSCVRTNTAVANIHSFDHSHREDLFGTHCVNNLVNAPFKMPENTILANNLVTADPGYEEQRTAESAGADPDRLKPGHPPNGLPAGVHASACLEGAASAIPDFRLRADSAARGAGQPIRGLNESAMPDAGAIPFGQPQWRAGHDIGSPPVPEPAWVRPDVQFMNRLTNPAFELGTLEGWTADGPGTAEVVKGNGWGNPVSGTGNAPTGTSKFELRLAGGAGGVEQRVTGLRPDTRYRLSGWVKVSDPAAAVRVEVTEFGGPAVSASSSETQWKRLILEFTTGPAANSASVRIRKSSGGPGDASADNFGLTETP